MGIQKTMGESWVQRYYCLNPRFLSEFIRKPSPLCPSQTMKNAPEQKNSWLLSSVGVVAPLENTSKNFLVKNNSNAKFKIYFKNGKELVLMAENEIEAAEWIKKISDFKKKEREISICRSVSRVISANDFIPEILSENLDPQVFSRIKNSVLKKNQPLNGDN